MNPDSSRNNLIPQVDKGLDTNGDSDITYSLNNPYGTFRTSLNNNPSCHSNPVTDSIPDSTKELQATPSTSKNDHPISRTHGIEFTKRKNWSHRIIDHLPDLYYVINSSGCFMYCSPSSLNLVGFSPSELIGRSIMDFIHVDDVDIFIHCIRQSAANHQFKIFYRFRKKDDRFIMFEVQGNTYQKEGTEAKYFFSIARPYPLKATSLMDTMLELKLENVILNQRLNQLRGSVEDFTSPQTCRNGELDDDMSEGLAYNDDLRNSLDLRGGRGDRGASSSTLTSNNSYTAAKSEKPVLAQLGTTTATTKKKRKHKMEDDIDRVCTECGKTDSPEWRKGPHGPKTLCNACGLRWAKRSRLESKAEDPPSIPE
ncbi:white collar 2 type of transcription factor [Basidiobolus ranarum]|uniref:White collar 2 type of transcription factor n=1 Tax=Basidiobolus ranarum TaxID=34480 RepID=A0ABR2VPN5_9FUNG